MAATHPTLFSWDHFEETTPELKRFEWAKESLPDEAIIKALNDKRRLRELNRNPALLPLCGFNPLPIQKKPKRSLSKDQRTGNVYVLQAAPTAPEHRLPSEWNFSRFLTNVIELEEQHPLLSGRVDTLRDPLMQALPDFGKHLGDDGKALESHSTGSNVKTPNRPPTPMPIGANTKPRALTTKPAKPGRRSKAGLATACI